MGGEPKRRCEQFKKRLVFYHIGFDDVGEAERIDDRDKDGNAVSVKLTERLDRIPTTFKISDADRQAIDRAVDAIVRGDNRCLVAIRDIVSGASARTEEAHRICSDRPGTKTRMKRL